MASAIPFPLHRSRSGSLYCIAELPALAIFGARYQEILDEYEKRLKDPKRQKQLYEEMVSSHAKFRAETLGKMRAHLEQLQNTDPKLFAQTATHLSNAGKRIGGFLSLLSEIKREKGQLSTANHDQILRQIMEMNPQGAEAFRQMQERMEQVMKANPELAAKIDPNPFANLLPSSPAAEDEGELEEEHPSPKLESYSPGKVHVTFGKSDKPTSNQEQLFQWVVTQQDKVAKDVSEKLFELYKSLDQCRQDNFPDADEEMLFPKAKAASELHDLIRPTRITLDDEEPIVQCHFDTTWKDLFGDQPQGLRLIYYKGKLCSDGSECDPTLSNELLKLLAKKPELAYKLGV